MTMPRICFAPIALAAIALAAVAIPAYCTPAAMAPLGALLKSADASVVVSVASVSASGGTTVLSVEVLRSVKGPLKPGDAMEITAPAGPQPGGSLAALTGRTGLWFLRRTPTGWSVMPVVIGNLPLDFAFIPVPSAAPAAPVGPAPEGSLAAELFGALSNDATASSAEEFLTMGMADVQSAQLDAALAAFAAGPAARTRRVAVTMMLRASSKQAPAQLIALSPTDLPGDTRQSLSRGLCQFRATDDNATRSVGQLSQSPYQDSIRSCAAYSLRATHSAAALPFLKVLLDDKSADLRYDALMGISAFALQIPPQAGVPTFPAVAGNEQDLRNSPSRDLFDKNEQSYISYWKDWLARHRN
jgi:hypothetical protein